MNREVQRNTPGGWLRGLALALAHAGQRQEIDAAPIRPYRAKRPPSNGRERKAAAEEKPGSDPGPHATIKSDDGAVIVQLAFNQVHIHEPDRWYMVSSKPLDKAEKHRMIFCGLIDGIMAGEHATFIKSAIHQPAGHWRKENGCQRIEDLDLPGRVVNQLEDAGYELLSEINTESKRKALAGIKGIGPATIQKIARAARKAGGR